MYLIYSGGIKIAEYKDKKEAEKSKRYWEHQIKEVEIKEKKCLEKHWNN